MAALCLSHFDNAKVRIFRDVSKLFSNKQPYIMSYMSVWIQNSEFSFKTMPLFMCYTKLYFIYIIIYIKYTK